MRDYKKINRARKSPQVTPMNHEVTPVRITADVEEIGPQVYCVEYKVQYKGMKEAVEKHAKAIAYKMGGDVVAVYADEGVAVVKT